jgi:hypothetical protein
MNNFSGKMYLDTYSFEIYEGQIDNGYPNGWGRAIYRDGSYRAV